ncbi:Mfa1 family fimbria major subunit [uncultured Porphyromonas sp.]|uniref:Mfa1 family fimbria major subunit n=1 Tax=uncultured Porphyromonas sp. TaxID=159274 RepID=UPI002598EC5A|nr:Mfa1 family fimbria major subunit [uncultured Porphyromonas sp.]
MKRNQIYHLVALLIGTLLLGACSQQSPSEEAINKGDSQTSMHFAVRVAMDRSLRGVNQEQKDESGTKSEQGIKQGLVLFKDYPSMQATLSEESAGTGIWKSAPMALQSEMSIQVSMTLLLNSNSLGTLTGTDFAQDRVIELKDLLGIAGTTGEGMLMTATVSDPAHNIVSIDSKATEQEVLQGSKNNFPFDVERVVAKVQITKSSSVTAELKDVGTLKFPLTYSMAGSAKKSYLFRDHAGSRTLSESSPNVYKDYISLIDDQSVPTDWDPKKGHPFLQRVSDKEGEAYILNGYYRNPKEVKDGTAERTSIDGGFYFLENSMYGNNKVASKKGEVKYNRIAYAKVYTKLTPTHAYTTNYKNGSYERVLASPQEFTEKQSYTMEISKELYLKLKKDPAYSSRLSSGFTFKPGGSGYQSYDLQVTDKPGTFYEGGDDGLLYLRLRDAVLMGNKSVRKYDEGRMVYLIPLNRQLDGAKGFVNYCDTRRNNIYDLNIASISGIGLNHDPVDPDDPNIPKPEDNPFEPPTDPQIPVEENDYLMHITAKILKWNLVEKHYALWN